MAHINKFVSKAKLSAIKDVLNQIGKTEGVVSLAWGLPNYSLDETVKEKLINEIQNNSNINKYPPFLGLKVLKDKIVETVQKSHTISLDSDNVIITAGAMEGLHIIFQTILNPGEEVILVTPCYASHMGEIELFGGVVVTSPLNEKNGWTIDIAEIEKKISKKTKAILVTNPNNPTGSVYDHKTVQQLIDVATKHDVFLIQDETYQFLAYDPPEGGVASLFDYPLTKNCITVRSFSKEYAMTGFRVGYVIAEKEMVSQMYKAHDSAVGFPPTISQYAGYLALQYFPESTRRFYQQDFRDKRDLMIRELQKYPEVLEFTPAKGAYYIFPSYKSSTKSHDLAKELLHKAKVGVVPGSGFGEGGEYHLRLSFAGEKKDIVEGVRRLGAYLKNMKKGPSL